MVKQGKPNKSILLNIYKVLAITKVREKYLYLDYYSRTREFWKEIFQSIQNSQLLKHTEYTVLTIHSRNRDDKSYDSICLISYLQISHITRSNDRTHVVVRKICFFFLGISSFLLLLLKTSFTFLFLCYILKVFPFLSKTQRNCCDIKDYYIQF